MPRITRAWIILDSIVLLLLCLFVAIDSKMSNNLHIAYYVTGHGFGHATRSIELIRGLLQTGKYSVSVASSIEPEFFITELSPYISSQNSLDARKVLLDTGGIQLDSIRLDPVRSVEAYFEQVHENRQALLDTEVGWIRENDIKLILVDASPLAGAIAEAANIKCIFVTNFTWDFVFEEMLKMVMDENLASFDTTHLNELREMIEQSKRDVAHCHGVIHYPGQAPMNEYVDVQKIHNGPMIRRPVRNQNLRNELNIPSEAKVLLLGFGGHTTNWKLQDEFLPPNWYCLVLRADESQMPSSRFRVLPHDSYVPDYIFAADVVLGKIGYGFVSECLGGGTALIYVPRVHWPEEIFLELVLHQYNAGIRMSLEDFQEGRWASFLDEAVRVRRSWTIDSSDWKYPDDATASTVHLIESMLVNPKKEDL
jgi:L-arabinokinase